MSDFWHQSIRELADQQTRFAPPARRQEQMARAAALAGEIDPAKRYPYSWVCFRVTDYRPELRVDPLIAGADLRHDLELFARRLERSLPAAPVEPSAEPLLTLAQVGAKLGVSAKTVGRWRSRGLVGRMVVRGGKRQWGFPAALVDRFAAETSSPQGRGASCRPLSDQERDAILYRARRLSQAGGRLTEVSRRIAQKLGRSTETVRTALKAFDRSHPNQMLFPTASGPLDAATKRQIYLAHQRGIPVQTLAKQHGKTRTSMYRVIHEVSAERLLQQPLDYIHHESFDDAAMADEILAPMPGLDKFEAQRKAMKAPKDVPVELAHLYEVPLLSKPQEQHLFRQMNFLKHRLKALRDRVNPATAKVSELEQMEELRARVEAVKEILIKSNMRLVVSYAKRRSNGDNLFELISDGNVSLMRAVDKFDYSRGNKFSTYASWAILKNYARSIPDEKNYRDRYLTGNEEVFEGKADWRSDESDLVAQADQARERITQLLSQLDPRTRDVIRMRAGLDGAEEMTLEQIGQHFGITKERVRQINVRGMKMLREKALAQKVELP